MQTPSASASEAESQGPVNPRLVPGKRWGLPLRAAIILLVIFNIATVAISISLVSFSSSQKSNQDAIQQGTANIMTMVTARQRDSSKLVANYLDSALGKVEALFNATNTQISQGKVNVSDFDTLGPLMISNLRAIRPTIMFHLIFNNNTGETIGAGPLYENASSSEPTQYIYNYMAANKTCAQFCPNVTTDSRVVSYFAKQGFGDTITIGNTLMMTPQVQFWKRAWYLVAYNQPAGYFVYSDPAIASPSSLMPRLIVQYVSFPVYDGTGNAVATGHVSVSTSNFALILDQLKARATANSVFYIVAPTGQVLGMSGLAQANYYAQSPLIYQPTSDTFALKTIWDFSLADYPLVNISAAKIFAYSGNDLTKDFADQEFQTGDYLFQVTTYKRRNYKWLIVSGAPANDYLADTLLLQARLADQLAETNRKVIIIATKFDFTAVQDPNFINGRFSGIVEFQNVQSKFLEMLQVFAQSLKQNRSLMNHNASSANAKTTASTSPQPTNIKKSNQALI
ncbi:hypothetical protein HDU93_009313 [Gonapodya sp. JEL0774]|nr:hypothetical protein HDU93_009313 [Gonapodya sp. JEL0774]